jgi:hypothetical protein
VPVVNDDKLKMPVLEFKFTAVLGTAALLASSAVTVIVDEVLLSDLTDVGDAESVSDAAVDAVVVDDVVPDPFPQPDNPSKPIQRNNAVNVFCLIKRIIKIPLYAQWHNNSCRTLQ